MSARVFRAPTLLDALQAVRATLGESAVILSTVEVGHGVEVTASMAQSRRGMRAYFERTVAPAPVIGLAVGSDVVALAAGLAGPPGLRVVGGSAPNPGFIAQSLQALDLPPDLAARLAAAGQGPLGWERILSWLKRGWPTPPPPLRRVGRPAALAFVGPARVGRSTLVRGLASRAVLDEPGRVVIVQVGFPGRRVDPMAELDAPVGAEVRIAHHPNELRQVVLDHGDVSAVFIDLPSIDVHDPSEQEALRRFVVSVERTCPEVAWHAVLSARWSTREATRTLRALEGAAVAGIAWTELDAVADPGTVIATTLRTNVPPSFLHGDPRGDGSSTGAATWDSIVDWLKAESGRAVTEA